MPRHLYRTACLLLLLFSLAGCKRDSAVAPGEPVAASPNLPDQFLRLMNAGKNYLDQGDATNALAVYRKAEALVPHDADLHLNLGNAYLAGADGEAAVREAD